MGDKVKIKNSFKSHQFCDGHEGVVREIIKDGHVHYCIQVAGILVAGTALASQIEGASAQEFVYPGQEKSWVLCKFLQVEKPLCRVLQPLQRLMATAQMVTVMDNVRASRSTIPNTTSLPVAQIGPTVVVQPIVYEKTSVYEGIHLGDRVAIQNSYSLQFCDGNEGIVRDIVKDGTTFLCVEIFDVPRMATLIAGANRRGQKPAYPDVDMGWVRCKSIQVIKI